MLYNRIRILGGDRAFLTPSDGMCPRYGDHATNAVQTEHHQEVLTCSVCGLKFEFVERNVRPPEETNV